MRAWILTLTGADNDPNTSSFDEVTRADITTANGYTNNVAATVYISAPQFTWSYEQAEFVGSDGSIRTRTARRKTWDVVCYPHSYDSSATLPDLDDVDALSAVLTKNFLYASIHAGGRNYPSTTTMSHPVAVEPDTQDSINPSSGKRTLTVTLKHRFLA